MNRPRVWPWVCLGLGLSGALVRGAERVKVFDVPPVVTKQARPEFPDTMFRFGNVGLVTVIFVVNASGEVEEPKVVEATHPDFIGPAIAAIKAWRFQPGRKAGVPVATRVAQTLTFGYADEKGVEPFSVGKKPPKDFPEELRYDTPPTVKRAVACVYPYDLLVAGTTGEAAVAFLVDETGGVQGVTVQKATHPEFGSALKAAMEAWRFEPARKDGKPSRALLSRTQEFNLGNRDLLITDETRRLRRLLGRDEEPDFPSPGALDAPPRAIYQMRPIYPPDLRQVGETGTATVDFIIDRKGIPQLPRLVDATRPEFGWAALTAIREWRFSPLTSGGKAVEIRVRQPLAFGLGDAEGQAADERGRPAQ